MTMAVTLVAMMAAVVAAMVAKTLAARAGVMVVRAAAAWEVILQKKLDVVVWWCSRAPM